MWVDSVKVTLVYDRRHVATATKPGTIDIVITYKNTSIAWSDKKVTII